VKAKRYFKIIPVYSALIALAGFMLSCGGDTSRISFNEHVRPILNKNCLVCHGGIKKLGEFSLLFEEDVFAPTKSGKSPIVPGSHSKSELYQRIASNDPEMRMPQDAEPLSKEEIDIIAEWIDQGAEWENHWAFVAPKSPEIPPAFSDWVKNNIDHFILTELDKAGLEPQTEAQKSILIRRLSLDLTGLPPEPDEVRDFVNDTSPQSYEKLVDHLLQSPHYGEKWAALWLDLARYADSKGYEADHARNIWRYRDWVIDAFNDDMPFDQFTIEQLAGDLLDNPTSDQLIATAFHRNSMTNTEGGTKDEEFRVVSIVDRVNTTFEAWQSLTIGCVQCHDHPYDPIRQKEFYQTFAFFNTTQDNDLGSEYPYLEIYREEDEKKIREVVGWIREIKKQPKLEVDEISTEHVRDALFPKLIPEYVDDFKSIILAGTIHNGSNNANTQKDKDYYFMYSDIDLAKLKGVKLNFSTDGADVRLEIFLDSLEGEKILAEDLPFTRELKNDKGFITQSWEVDVPDHAVHDLIFQLINVTGELPDGIISIKEITLDYDIETFQSPKLLSLQEQLKELRRNADFTPIMKEEKVFIRKTHILERGNWMIKGDEVALGVPSFLPEMSSDLSRDRLGLAKWMVNSENPLTARVLVNRLWEQLFGTGIVETSEDFGTQGDKPSHPEMLDYLAREAMDNHNWSVKRILKEMVMSAAYRQSSHLSAEKLEKDPYNRLLSRGPRFRLSAEQIRDQALAVGGLLDKNIGGKSVMPSQPDGVWQVIYSNLKWETTEAEKYRRGLYTFWRRTTPYPSMVSFDSPSREFCVSRRIRTNTPLQALVMLNDPVYIEAAQGLAGRMSRFAPHDTDQAIRIGYEIALCRQPDDETVRILTDLYESAKEEIVAVSNQTEMKINPLVVVASAIMNLDEFVTKE